MGKIFTFNLPDIGEGVVEGEIIEWLKKEGDAIGQDEPVVVVMTDKATVELPAPYPGILSKQYVKAGEIAIKGKPVYDIELTTTEEITKKTEISPAAIKPVPSEKKEEPTPVLPAKLHEGEKVLATPPVRKLAKDLGISISEVPGTGKEGRVLPQDLQAFVKSRHVKEYHETQILKLSDDEVSPIHGIRQLMAKKMSESHANIPQFSYFEQVDATRLVQLRNNFKDKALKEGIRITYMPFIIRALVLTIKKYPFLNSSFDAEHRELSIHKHYNIGIAISTHNGLIVPVLKDVQNIPLQDLIRAYESLKIKALENKLSPNDMKEGTITISNYGVLGGGGRWATPIINYPEVAILAVARIQKYPVVRDEAIVIRDMLNVSWSFDHRIIDGERGALCSQYFCSLINNPANLL